MNWIRIAVTLPDDPRIHELADALKLDVDRALAKFLRVLFKLPEHARDGRIAHVSAATIELWAGWRGKKGAFDTAFRMLFCDESGTVRSWEKHNGAAIREADAARERMRKLRGKSGERSPNVPEPFASDVTGRDVVVVTDPFDSNNPSAKHTEQGSSQGESAPPPLRLEVA